LGTLDRAALDAALSRFVGLGIGVKVPRLLKSADREHSSRARAKKC
jgi:hypothetical protein